MSATARGPVAVAAVAATRARPSAPAESSACLLTVAELAARLGTSEDYVYRHAADLGARRLPGRSGGRGRLRFDWEATLAALPTVRSCSDRSHEPEPPAAPADRAVRRPAATGTGVPLLPVRGPR